MCRTFGGITARHIWEGLIRLEPALAASLGFGPPPKQHAFPPPSDPCIEPAYNSWVVVPVGHVLSHIANLPSANVRDLDYEVHKLELPETKELLPFLVMDVWTVMTYITKTIETVIIPIDQDRVSIADQWVELVPLVDPNWIRGCVAGQEYKTGSLKFRLTIAYTAFTKGFRDDATLLPTLSDNFPRLSAEFRSLIDNDEVARSIAPRSKAAATQAVKESMADLPTGAGSLYEQLDEAMQRDAVEPMDQDSDGGDGDSALLDHDDDDAAME